MAVQINYASTGIAPEFDEPFEQALERGRTAPAEPLSHLIGGANVAEGETFERRDPCDEQRLLSLSHAADRELVDRAVTEARQASKGWRRTPYAERIAMLRQAIERIDANVIEMAGLLSAETGKSRVEALGEARESMDLIGQYCDEMERLNGLRTPLKPQGDDVNTDVLKPYGVFGVISPFNFPVALTVNMMSGALVTGNTVVVKPSDKAPRSTATVVRLIAEQLPDGVVNLVHGGLQTGQAVAQSDVDGIAFTGSAEVGWDIYRSLGAGAYAKPVLAEMGGCNPAIVTRSADLDQAVSGIIRSAYGLSGQKCSACSRVVVDAEVHDELVAKLVNAALQLVVGPPEERGMTVGPVIDEPAAKRIDKALALAREDGRVECGGRRAGTLYFEPIVVTGLPRDHELTRTEIFGPFLTVTKVESFDEAMNEANAVDYGLSAGVYTGQDAEVEEFLDRIEAGVVYVNRPTGATTGAWPGFQSFAGWKASGTTGKGGLGPWYLPGFCREQSQTVTTPRA